jgi:eukaryotic-like serine/threonine-protein kinase
MDSTTGAGTIVRFDSFEFNLSTGELRQDGVLIRLQPQPTLILTLLASRPGDLVTRGEIQQRIWGAETFVDFDTGLNSAIRQIRHALKERSGVPRIIETVPRRGYRFLAPLEKIGNNGAGQDRQDADQDHSASSHVPVVLPQQSGIGPRTERIRLAAIILGLFAFAGCLVTYAHYSVTAAHQRPASEAIRPRPSVVVLRFTNLSGRLSEDWLSTAFSEMISMELSGGQKLRIIPEENTARMRIDLGLGEAQSYGRETLARISRYTGADLVVAGSYTTLHAPGGDQVRLDLRLQDAMSGETVAAASQTGTVEDLFKVVSQAGAKLRANLGIAELSSVEAAGIKASLPNGSEAVRLYAEGLEKTRLFENLAARDLLEKAAVLEPRQPLIHSALARAWSGLGYDEKAKEEAGRAFDFSSNLRREQKLSVEGQYREATREWQRAIEIYHTLFVFFPDNLDYGLQLANAQASAGEGQNAIGTVETLRNLPLPMSEDPRIDFAEAVASYRLGDYNRELKATGQVVTRGRQHGLRLLVAQAQNMECWAFRKTGQLTKAIASCEQAKRVFDEMSYPIGSASALANMAAVLNEGGHMPEARAKYEQALKVVRTTGDRRRTAAILNNLAEMLPDDPDHQRKMYEEALAIYREIGSKDGVSTSLGNIAGIFLLEGDLTPGQQANDEALKLSRSIGNQELTAAWLLDGASVLYHRGNLSSAEALLGEALSIDKANGNKTQSADDLSSLGNLARAKGDLPTARQRKREALEIREQLGNAGDIARIKADTAELAMDEGNPGKAEAPLRDAIAKFRSGNLHQDEILAHATLAECLLSDGRIDEAKFEIAAGNRLSIANRNYDVRVRLGIASDRVRSALGQSADAIRVLSEAIAEAKQKGYVTHEFQARLARGEIELASGNVSAGRAHLATLESDATGRGFLAIAKRARDAGETNRR